MTFILTALGNQVDMSRPALGSINLATIAHHLSLINRFSGATCRPYSVAEHSLLVCEILQREMHITSPEALMAGLMHDAHEAYTNDMATPVKREVVGWDVFENRFERIVRSAFGLHTAAYQFRAEIRRADLIALATERAQLLPPGGDEWTVLAGIRPVDWVDLLFSTRACMPWFAWRKAFTRRADQLDYARERTRASNNTASKEQP